MIPRAKDESESQGPSASNYGKAERMLRSERVLSKRWPARHMEREVHIRAPTLALLLPEQQVRPRHWVRREPWEVLLGCTGTLSLNCHNHSCDIVAVPPNLTISGSGNKRGLIVGTCSPSVESRYLGTCGGMHLSEAWDLTLQGEAIPRLS